MAGKCPHCGGPMADEKSPKSKYDATEEKTGDDAFDESGAGITDVAGTKEKIPNEKKMRTVKAMGAMLAGKIKMKQGKK